MTHTSEWRGRVVNEKQVQIPHYQTGCVTRGRSLHPSDPQDFLLLNRGPVKSKTIVIEERSLIDISGALCAGPVNGLQN